MGKTLGPARKLGSGTARNRKAGRLEASRLPTGQLLWLEIADQLMEQTVPIDLGLEPEEHRAQADGGPVHQHELPGRGDAAEPAQLAMHLLGRLAAIDAVLLLLDPARPILQQGRVDELGPKVEDLD